ncbi:DUF2164 domain-containing protein [Virgibacillus soli]|uniref:DUF2164 domain-containing protein n=1 Tax=Paracerasibacillus soli TaxID=480284 RepID=A0ABU5CU83_9BACI|nr:DUF2164 domain-containing protein [Virgibacillus soli]MDY0408983.1 DUF2164 domain-containing protein [Virgibacillus soli]
MKFPNENKRQIIEMVKDYYNNEHGMEIGDLAAENFFDFIYKEIGPYFYNQGVRDAKSILEQKIMNLEEDLASLERPTYRRNI